MKKTNWMTLILALALAVAFVGCAGGQESGKSTDQESAAQPAAEPAGEEAEPEGKPAEKRAKIDARSEEVLKEVFEESERARELYDEAVGYAVFDNTKVALLVSGGGGSGVAVQKATGERTYMKMGTVGVGLGIGAKTYQVIFLFETDKAFGKFVDKGWQADAQAGAAAGTAGAGAKTTFANGIAVFVRTKKGLMASADVSGTKYWKADKLNE
jgi:lipid-binding SYLF domain-containing protein